MLDSLRRTRLAWRGVFGGPSSLVCLGLCLGACATFHQEVSRVSATKYRIRCEARLAECLLRVDSLCGEQSYDVIEARDERHRLGPKLGDAQSEFRRSSALVECRSDNPVLFGNDAEKQPETPTEKLVLPARGDAASAQGDAQKSTLCTPGSTQVCVGPAACRGGQVCLADGSAFGPCDCGQQTSGPASEETPEPLPAMPPAAGVPPALSGGAQTRTPAAERPAASTEPASAKQPSAPGNTAKPSAPPEPPTAPPTTAPNAAPQQPKDNPY